MNQTLEKTKLSFSDNILQVKFQQNTVVEVEDVVFIFCYARQQSKRKPYGVLFDSSSTHEFSEDAITYFAESGYLSDVVAIAYISRSVLSKIRLKLLMIFERPPVRPKMFTDKPTALMWLREQVQPVAKLSS